MAMLKSVLFRKFIADDCKDFLMLLCVIIINLCIGFIRRLHIQHSGLLFQICHNEDHKKPFYEMSIPITIH